jgi:chromosome segregation ATPase
VTTADCDPNQVGNVITSAACSNEGQFRARQENLASNLGTISAEVERERIAISEANSRIRALQREQRITSEQAAQINREIAALNSDVDRLSRAGSDPTQAAQIRARIDSRQAAINQFADIAVF